MALEKCLTLALFSDKQKKKHEKVVYTFILQ